MKVCGLFNKSEEIWLNMEKLEKAHRKSGRIIRKKIEQVVTKNTNHFMKKDMNIFLMIKEVVQLKFIKSLKKASH